MKARQCPVDGSCPLITGWEAFLAHVYEVHTEGPEANRWETVDRLLRRGHRPVPSQVVPKVTADPRTHALWALLGGDETRARETVLSMTDEERRTLSAAAARLIDLAWSAA